MLRSSSGRPGCSRRRAPLRAWEEARRSRSSRPISTLGSPPSSSPAAASSGTSRRSRTAEHRAGPRARRACRAHSRRRRQPRRRPSAPRSASPARLLGTPYTAAERDTRHAYVSDSGTGDIVVVDAVEGRVVARAEIGAGVRHRRSVARTRASGSRSGRRQSAWPSSTSRSRPNRVCWRMSSRRFSRTTSASRPTAASGSRRATDVSSAIYDGRGRQCASASKPTRRRSTSPSSAGARTSRAATTARCACTTLDGRVPARDSPPDRLVQRAAGPRARPHAVALAGHALHRERRAAASSPAAQVARSSHDACFVMSR